MNPENQSIAQAEPQKQVDNKTVQATTQAQPAAPAESVEQINWRKFREEKERERKAREEADKRAEAKAQEAAALKAALEAIVNKPGPAHREEQEQQEPSDADRIKAQVEAVLAIKEKEYEEKRRQREAQEFPQRLTQAYNDFDKVCTTENLDYLEYHYPEVASAFKHMPEGFDKWSSIYKAVKRFVVNPDSRKDEKKAQNNMQKPQSMAVGGVTQTGDTAPIQLDDKRRQENWKRMQRVLKGG